MESEILPQNGHTNESSCKQSSMIEEEPHNNEQINKQETEYFSNNLVLRQTQSESNAISSEINRKPESKPTPCFFFQHSKCKFGDSCRFSHEQKPINASLPQQFYQQQQLLTKQQSDNSYKFAQDHETPQRISKFSHPIVNQYYEPFGFQSMTMMSAAQMSGDSFQKKEFKSANQSNVQFEKSMDQIIANEGEGNNFSQLLRKVQNGMYNYRQYRFDENLTQECKELASQARSEKLNNFLTIPSAESSSEIPQDNYSTATKNEEEQYSSSLIGDQTNSNMIVMRHAMSDANYIMDKYTEGKRSSGKALQMFKQHFRYFLSDGCDLFFDAPLHPLGVKQCRDMQAKNAEINYTRIFVSPLRRAMQTCVEIFKAHPNRDKIVFYVHPGIAEVLKKDSDVFLETQFNEIVESARKEHNIAFDTTTFYSSSWQFKQLQSSHRALRNTSGSPQLIKTLIQGVFPQPIEDFGSFCNRIDDSIYEIENQTKIQKGITGIVTHSLVTRQILKAQKIKCDSEVENLSLVFYRIE